MTEADLTLYLGMINARYAALNIAHRALRDGASDNEKDLARAAIESVLPELKT